MTYIVSMAELHAREKAGLPDTWHAFDIISQKFVSNYYLEVKGMSCPSFAKGERKDWPDFSQGDETTLQTIYLSVEEHQAWVQAKEDREVES